MRLIPDRKLRRARRTTPGEGRSRALDGLRGLAALMVFFHHSWSHAFGLAHARSAGIRADYQVFHELRLGLVCFFVLSGYLLYRPFLKAADEGGSVRIVEYLRRRAARIFPAYWVVLAAAIALDIQPAKGHWHLWQYLVLAQNYSDATFLHFDSATWTLGIELAFYAALPLLAVAGALWARRTAVRVGLVLLLIPATWAWNLHSYTVKQDLDPRTLPGYLGYFAVGMLVATLCARGDWRLPRWAGPALVAAAVALVAGDAVWHVQGRAWEHLRTLSIFRDSLAAAGFGLLILVVVRGRGVWSRWPAWRPLAALGTVSYGFYLWHLPVLIVLGRFHVYPLPGILPAALMAFPIALGLATLSWFAIERPAMRWAHRRPKVAPPSGARGRLEPAAARGR